MSRTLNAIILAAGQGTRMKSSLPKVMHCIGGKPMLQHNIELAERLACEKTAVVIGHGAEIIRQGFSGQALEFCLQEEQKGTGHAVSQALPVLNEKAMAVVLYGDVPMLQADTLIALIEKTGDNSMGLLTAEASDPDGLGRIIRNGSGDIVAIVEHRDATPEQLKITEVNTGIMVIPVSSLNKWLPALQNNNKQGEYYLTDVIAMAVAEGCSVESLLVEDENEVAGVNTRRQLAELERYFQKKTADKFMDEGVTFSNPELVSLRGEITLGIDVSIDINVVMEGRVTCEKNVTIGPGCVLKNCHISEGTVLEAYTHIEQAWVGKHCNLGPFARLRPGTELAEKVKLGNFIETKKAKIARASKVNHFSYIGDAVVGEDVNVGAGAIVCNYDGVNKHQTLIGNDVFIGSNSTLVSPVVLADGAFVAAGSTITGNVDAGQLAIGRGRQRNIDGWKRPVKSDRK